VIDIRHDEIPPENEVLGLDGDANCRAGESLTGNGKVGAG
jgi:hypothetical protein